VKLAKWEVSSQRLLAQVEAKLWQARKAASSRSGKLERKRSSVCVCVCLIVTGSCEKKCVCSEHVFESVVYGPKWLPSPLTSLIPFGVSLGAV